MVGPRGPCFDGSKHELAELLHESRSTGCVGSSGVVAGDLPSKVSTQSCRPRLCRGLTTQWLLVAVMSNTSQPSSEAQRVRLSSRNRSDSLQEKRRDTGSRSAGHGSVTLSPASCCWRGRPCGVGEAGGGPPGPQKWVHPSKSQAWRHLSSCDGKRECVSGVKIHIGDRELLRGTLTRHTC